MQSAGQKGTPTQAGQYYLMEKIAQGGMAEIFKGLSYDVHGLKKTVCIKKILPHLAANKEFIDSLVDEAKLAVKLVHGNIAQTYDLGKVADDYFMVMEFVDGKSLSQIHKKCVAKGELIPIPYLVYFVSEVLNGLNYMHRRADENGAPLHIVHRDISPQNIMVSYSGTVKIIDFGIAKAVFIAGPTDSGILKGKFAYMSPEQALGDAIDQRSDIFSIGIILHEMLTGKRLFKADDSRETIRNVRRAKVLPPSSLKPDLSEELDRIALRALSKDRRHRYPSASEMHAELVKFLHTNYPDFKPSDAADFVRNLFEEELKNPERIEADSKTPHLIIDRSNSALADDSQFESTGALRAPVDMGEYMLDETAGSAPSGRSETHTVGERKEVPLLDEDVAEEKTVPTWCRRLIKKQWMLTAGLGVASVALLATALFFYTSKKDEAPPVATETPAALAEILVTTVPPDATVSFDGKEVGRGSPVAVKKVKPGKEHNLTVSREGYRRYERRITLEPGEIMTITAALVSGAPANAKLEIVTEPPGATVFINDRETSHRTPAMIAEIPAEKETTIGLYLAGHKFWTKKLMLKSDETRTIDVALAKDFGSVVIESDPPKALVMIDGSPAGQTPVTRDNLESGRIYKIEVWLEGYSVYTTELKASVGHKQEIRAILTPEPKKPEPQPQSPPPPPTGIIDTPVPVENPR